MCKQCVPGPLSAIQRSWGRGYMTTGKIHISRVDHVTSLLTYYDYERLSSKKLLLSLSSLFHSNSVTLGPSKSICIPSLALSLHCFYLTCYVSAMNPFLRQHLGKRAPSLPWALFTHASHSLIYTQQWFCDIFLYCRHQSLKHLRLLE